MNFTLVPKAYALNEFQADYTGWTSGFKGANSGLINGDLGTIISTLLPYLLTLAGLILFAMLVFGGFTMLTGAASKDGMEKGKKMVTNALVGFAVIFLAYWIAQVLQVIFKVNITS